MGIRSNGRLDEAYSNPDVASQPDETIKLVHSEIRNTWGEVNANDAQMRARASQKRSEHTEW